MKSICFICNHDSSLKMSGFLAKAFRERGYRVHFFIIGTENEQLRRLLEEFAIEEVLAFGSLRDFFLLDRWSTYDVLHILALGPVIRDFCAELYLQLAEKPQRRPLLITGLIGHLGGDVAHCYMHRQACDLIYAGGPFDEERLRTVASHVGDPGGKIVATGLPIFDGMHFAYRAPEKKMTLFAGQPTFPKRKEERQWIVKNMIELARQYPEQHFVLKPRVRPGEKTIHQAAHHYEDLLAALEVPPPTNFEISYRNIQELMQATSCLLTISSTAALEAMVAGIPVGIICDSGISEQWGNQIFLGTGLLVSFLDLKQGHWPKKQQAQIERLVNPEAGASLRIVDEVERLMREKEPELERGLLPEFMHMKTTLWSQQKPRLNTRADASDRIVCSLRYTTLRVAVSVLRALRRIPLFNRLLLALFRLSSKIVEQSKSAD
ncbi:MAG: hypothetical protein MK135_01280 [Polyangiaceae bacterium]|nr:hypothetical protein [Polyangiaceae bacterium]